MFLKLLNFIRGYVVVAVSGFSAERFINLAARRSIYLWDAVRDEGRLRISCSIKGFKLLRYCSKKSGCKLRIVHKAGLPFILFRYKKRRFLMLGFAAFIGLAIYLTSFIWLVTVDGNERLETKALLDKLAEMGVSSGNHKSGLVLRDIERALMAAFPEIVWVNLDIKGTRARLSVVEGIVPPRPVETGQPCDIVAAKDGIITSMATELGRPMFQPGDVVKAGDVLVSGEVVVGSDEYGFTSYFVRASSVVLARRYYEYNFEVPLAYVIKSFTGNVKRNYGIILFDRQLFLENSKSPYLNYDIVSSENRLHFGEDYPLPAVWFENNYREFIPITVRRSLEEAKIMSRTIVNARILRELPVDTEITDMEFYYVVDKDVLYVSAVVTAVENIGVQVGLGRPGPAMNNEQ
ncbi:MAG: sporulation protein YqfD [Clostridiales bacterium]|jgi:similar to stage IV sporulation protein|nr:sporulation protein YqfD [Clostridiales bacterium]